MADESALTDIVRRAAQANAKFYKGWLDLSLDYARGLSEIFSGSLAAAPPIQEMDAGTGVIVLEGEAGTLVRGTFLVSNDLERSISCQFIGSDYKDPAGASVSARTVFEPPALELGMGEQRVVGVTIAIDETLVAGVGYAGEISIRGMDGFAVPVVLRRQHGVNDMNATDSQMSEAEGGNAGLSATPAATTSTAPKTTRHRATAKKKS